MKKKMIAVSFLGTKLDAIKRSIRWTKWRPNISLVKQTDLVIDELYLLHGDQSYRLADYVKNDIALVSPQTKVHLTSMNFDDPWDFEEVYARLYDFCLSQTFDIDECDYLFHITTGTHVAQICTYLLTESRHFPGRLIQTAPDQDKEDRSTGKTQIIDLDLSRYDQLATRFDHEHQQGTEFLKGGIATRNKAFNQLIVQIEKVAIRSKAPILLTGPTGAGKSQLATRIYQLKKMRSMLTGELVVVNCATLKGENAMAALFGHTKGAFTGAASAREGFLRAANNGLLFLDEIGELGLEEQAMLLRAIENHTFHPVGSDQDVQSNFQLIAGTNRDLREQVAQGHFRDDLLARINLWTYTLPALKDRKEDLEANIDFELGRFSQQHGHQIRFNKEARQTYLKFAHSPQALWQGNFRDLGASVTRLCTLADSSRIAVDDVEEEIIRLKSDWQPLQYHQHSDVLPLFLSEEAISQLDQFDRFQLNAVLRVCMNQSSMAAAGRVLFDISRQQKATANDSTRLQKYLARFGLKWRDIQAQKQ
ncbi:RNA repair transcriptional activator RtcR [Vibrio quintilis]|uniref:Transcriptional regulatory protein QseF n=1 Tax=Vibrio quintilis TaxID=1117707 RepID=A0A1M7Z077_9VIBR|nr:RNA repair transcriptional activator RtcR [Vibrio quintilis]SHO58254.1 Transcriptional regulatory protein QseF [Vibrio quintilis]